jgi:phage FluMu gp28-like protein
MKERTRVKPLRWLPYHKRLINERAQYALMEKSRRVGFDYALAYGKTMERLTAECERDLWYTSADESAAAEFIEYCRFFHERRSLAVDHFIEDIEDPGHPKGAIKTFCIRFENQTRINALSSSPRRLRSKGGDVAISEFAFHDEPTKLYNAAQPAILWGGNLIVGSTHNGEGSKFNRFCADAKAYAGGERERGGRTLTPWSYHFVDIYTAVAQGLVELINESKGTNFTREGFIANARAGCESEDHWLQEFCCKPSSETTAWLPYDLIYSCEDAKCPAPGAPLWDVAEDTARYAGIDVGRKKDRTAVWIVGTLGDVAWTRRIIVLDNLPIPQQADIIEGALREAGVRRTCIDATGIGLGLGEELQRRLGRWAVELVTFTAPVKEKLAVPVRQRFEERTLRIPDHAEVREDLHMVRKTITASGNVRFDAARSESGHADRFWALSLALEAVPQGAQVGVMLV